MINTFDVMVSAADLEQIAKEQKDEFK